MRKTIASDLILAIMVVASASTSQNLCARSAAEHVVVVVWDGMRPDYVSPGFTPNLYALATNGVFFKNHHSLYISTTEVNGAGLATGCHPSHNGIIANNDYRPELSWLGPQATESVESVRRGDLLTHGHYLLAPTLAELLHQAGIATAIAGTKPVVFLHDRAQKRDGEAARNSLLLYGGTTMPRAGQEKAMKANDNKPFPSSSIPNKDRDAWTTKALIKGLWQSEIPRFSLLWLSEPDASQHNSGPGSSNAVAAIESSDAQLGLVVEFLREKKQLDKTDLIITADHGFSTIERSVDILEGLKRAKFKAFRRFDDPERGDILVVGLGGSVCFYVFEHDEAVARRLAEFLQTTDYAGVLFSRIPTEGTFPLETVRLDASNVSPDLVMSYRWTSGRSEFGAPGLLTCEGSRGTGTHGSLSPYDMHPNLVAAGPDFKHGMVSDIPTGNLDIVPTVLYLLDVAIPETIDGRVIVEALASNTSEALKPITTTIDAASSNGLFRWKQYLKSTQVGKTLYFDEGNGEASIR